jgi:hypothetical protein
MSQNILLFEISEILFRVHFCCFEGMSKEHFASIGGIYNVGWMSNCNSLVG